MKIKIEPISLNNPRHEKTLYRLGLMRKYKQSLQAKLLEQAYTIINNPNNEIKNKRL